MFIQAHSLLEGDRIWGSGGRSREVGLVEVRGSTTIINWRDGRGMVALTSSKVVRISC
jgi:hypothetical protein